MLWPEYGYPLRVVVPGVQGVSWVKYLRRIEVGDQPYGSKFESVKVERNSRGYNWSIRVVKQEGQSDKDWLARLVEIDRQLRVKFGE